MKKNICNREQGGALVLVVIVLLVVSTLTMSVLFMFNSNFKQARMQQHRTEAYYIAYSGIELALAALLKDDKEFLNEIIYHDNVKKEDTITFVDGSSVKVLAQKTDLENFNDWIEIKAIATLRNDQYTYSRSLLINPSDLNNHSSYVWKDN